MAIDKKNKDSLKNNEKTGMKTSLVINKTLIDKISKKINEGELKENKKNKDKKNIITEANPEHQENEELVSNKTIKSTIIRNDLIGEIKKYYCKFIPQSNNSNPNSRMEATFTPYYNGLFLYGGMQTHDTSDLWLFIIDSKRYKP